MRDIRYLRPSGSIKHAYTRAARPAARGQESAGIVSTDGSSMYMRREMGLVSDIFNEETLREIPGTRR